MSAPEVQAFVRLTDITNITKLNILQKDDQGDDLTEPVREYKGAGTTNEQTGVSVVDQSRSNLTKIRPSRLDYIQYLVFNCKICSFEHCFLR